MPCTPKTYPALRRAAIILIAFLLTSAILPLGCHAVEKPSYEALAGKAERFYKYGEWASAAALYTLMIEARPEEARLYGRAIVTAAMRERPEEEVDLLRKAIAHHVAFDSVFASVERESFAIGQTALYEHFLRNVGKEVGWLGRTVSGYLLRYYTYRRNPQGIIALSEQMLQGAPDNEAFLYSLAQGYLLAGATDRALGVYTHIIELNPKAYEALLYLGNYYAPVSGQASLAKEYLGRAYALRPTPYVAGKLRTLP